jgi:hypothetical protein
MCAPTQCHISIWGHCAMQSGLDAIPDYRPFTTANLRFLAGRHSLAPRAGGLCAMKASLPSWHVPRTHDATSTLLLSANMRTRCGMAIAVSGYSDVKRDSKRRTHKRFDATPRYDSRHQMRSSNGPFKLCETTQIPSIKNEFRKRSPCSQTKFVIPHKKGLSCENGG